MAYRKIYPSKLSFSIKGDSLHVYSNEETQYNPDLWGIKYLFDRGLSDKPAKIYIKGAISNTMALRMYFLKYLFPSIEFHDEDNYKFITIANEIIKNIGTKYVTYIANDHPLNNRGTKDKLESRIETELADNLSSHIPEFSIGAKVVRQFPANIFRDRIGQNSRITNKLWIDMVSINRIGELSPIELKVGGNIPLDLFAQGLDYGIYCYLFKKHIKDNWFNIRDSKKDKITIYYIGEEFHPALVGRNEENGIVSLIRNNELFNIVFIKITVDKKRQCIIGKSKVIFDARN